jgi:amino acid transporter
MNRRRAPWIAIIALAMGWAACLNLGFERLVTLDIFIYGLSLALEFLALVVLRIREPHLKRPFRVPGGLFGAIAVGIAPVALLGFDLVRSESQSVWGISSFWLGAMVVGAGVLAYAVKQLFKPAGWAVPQRAEPVS